MNPLQNENTEIIKLTPPARPTKETIIGYNYGLRPYRNGGIRLEKESYKNKTFYHNYGHGGAGVSLAYGCATHIVELFLKDQTPESFREVAIVGSGYMGLMQSIILRDLGYSVTIYAKDFPRESGMYNENEVLVTSQVAGGLWMPSGIDVQNKPLHFLLGKITYNYYKECIEKQKYKGLSFKPAYIIGMDNPIIEYCPPDLLSYRNLKIDFGNGKLHDAVTYTTVMMDGDCFLKELIEEAKSKGVKFIKKDFKGIDDICELKEKNIFNCTGASSYFLFRDKNIEPISGHLVYLKRDPQVDYFLSSTSQEVNGKKVTLYPQGNKLAVGFTYEKRGWLEKPDPECWKTIIRNLNELLEHRAGVKSEPQPKL